jgi:hypothetical protein
MPSSLASTPECGGVAVIVAVHRQIWRTFQALGANSLRAQDVVSYWLIESCQFLDLRADVLCARFRSLAHQIAKKPRKIAVAE